MATGEPKVEDKPTIEELSGSDDEPPELEAPTTAAGGAGAAVTGQDKGPGKQSRSEKKARKAVTKLGMKPVNGIIRVTVKKAKNMLFVISKPDVFKSPNSEIYIIFGEAKIEDLSQSAAMNAASDFRTPENAAAAAAASVTEPTKKAEPKPAASAGPEEPVDETGVEAKDIDLVMSQTKASRSEAVKALKQHNGDIVNAIMDLTM